MQLIDFLSALLLLTASVVLALVGYQAIKLAQEARELMNRTNRIVARVEQVGIGIQAGIGEAADMVTGFRGISKIVSFFKSRSSHE
jgi:hypothetical protein